MKRPDPQEIRAMRKSYGLSQEGAAALVHCKRLSWWNWEAGRNAIPAAEWELFRLKVGDVQLVDILQESP